MFEIVIDATIDLDEKYKKKTKVVPLYVIDAEKNRKVPITSDYSVFYEDAELMKRWAEGKLKTSQPAIGDFVKVIEESNHDEILILTISSKLSGTYNAAVKASKSCEKRVFVFDTLSASIGAGIYVKKALEMRKKGCSIEQVIKELKKIDAKVYLAVTDIKYLFSSGRINAAKYLFLKFTKLTPILFVKNGSLQLLKLSKDPVDDLEKISKELKEVVWGKTEKKILGRKKALLASPIIAVNVGPAFGIAGIAK